MFRRGQVMVARVIVGAALLIGLYATASDVQPIEIGRVTWLRNLDVALTSAKTSSKPVFALFQEVPGCAGCKTFGRDVLSDPLLVDAIETEFVPVVIYNNRGGYDAEILRRYREPSWNYQVVRFLDATGADIIARRDRVWTRHAIAGRMADALRAVGRPVPGYLYSVIADRDPGAVSQAVFAMHCFWVGEATLGALDGVVRTEAGFYDGHEVVRVWYDDAQLSFGALVGAATAARCANRVYIAEGSTNRAAAAASFVESQYRRAPERDQKRQLLGSKWARLTSLTPFQRTKVNAFIHSEPSKALGFIGPTQRQAERRQRQ